MIGEGATEDTNYHEVWTVKPLINELSPLGGSGLVSGGLGQMMSDTKFLLPISGQLSPGVNPLNDQQTKHTKERMPPSRMVTSICET